MHDPDAPADLFPETAVPRSSEEIDPPVTWREPAAAAGAAALFDLLVYRTGGYAAAGLFLLGAAALLVCGSPFRGANRKGFAAVAALLALTALRLAWLGWAGAVAAGVLLVAGLALARGGRRVWATDTVLQLFQAIPAGPPAALTWRWLAGARRIAGRGGGATGPAAERTKRPLSVALPVAAGVAFAGLFLMANPDLKTAVGAWLSDLSLRFGDAVRWLVPHPGQAVLWVLIAGLAAGLLRPLVRSSPLDPLAERERASAAGRAASGPAAAAGYEAVRNTLLVVVGVFGAYLPFEFVTLWRRDFPDGFYYAGYAHEGAAWLTVALAAATALLSALFRGSLLNDPRSDRLRTLAWVWSALNFLLVAAVCNRLLIYVGYNGLSRLRVVGFLGIAAVALGFAAVVVKIARGRGFVWLVRRQLRAAALVVLAGVLLPVDWIAHRYNAARVVAGDPAPLALIGNHEIDLGGLLALEPVLRAGDPIAARGVAGRMGQAAAALAADGGEAESGGPLDELRRFQLARVQFRRMYGRNRGRIEALLAGDAPAAAAGELREYGLHWW